MIERLTETLTERLTDDFWSHQVCGLEQYLLKRGSPLRLDQDYTDTTNPTYIGALTPATTLVTRYSSSIIHHPSSIIHHPSSIIHQSSSIIYHSSSIIHHPSNSPLPPPLHSYVVSVVIRSYDSSGKALYPVVLPPVVGVTANNTFNSVVSDVITIDNTVSGCLDCCVPYEKKVCYSW